MASSGARLFRHSIPAFAGVVSASWTATTSGSAPTSKCEEKKDHGMINDEKGEFHNLFPKRQLWQPKVEYPLWDKNWDGRLPAPTGDEENDRKQLRELRKNGVTRHIILVRHGQVRYQFRLGAETPLPPFLFDKPFFSSDRHVPTI